MLADLIQIAILAVAIVALVLSIIHRTKLEGYERENRGVDRYLENRLDKHEARLDALEK